MLKHFSGTIIATFSMSLSFLVWHVIFVLKLDKSVALAPLKITILPSSTTAGIYLQYCHKLPDIFE